MKEGIQVQFSKAKTKTLKIKDFTMMKADERHLHPWH
jgi:hypothetical protein